jgi:anti-anti-sigma factor
MGLTMLPPPAGTVPIFRCALTTDVVYAKDAPTVVGLRGEADISTRPVMCDVFSRVIALGAGDVVIDLSETTFIDSAAVRVLATARELLDRAGRRLIFRSPSRLAVRVIEVFGLTGLVEVPTPVV